MYDPAAARKPAAKASETSNKEAAFAAADDYAALVERSLAGADADGPSQPADGTRKQKSQASGQPVGSSAGKRVRATPAAAPAAAAHRPAQGRQKPARSSRGQTAGSARLQQRSRVRRGTQDKQR